MSDLKYGVPLMFRTPIWVPLITSPDTRVKMRPLSYKLITTLTEARYITDTLKLVEYHDSLDFLLNDSILELENAVGFPDISTFIRQLPQEDIEYLTKNLITISTLTQEQSLAIKEMIDIVFDKQMMDDNFDCETCIHKKLQKMRACSLIPEEDRSKDFVFRINRKVYTTCPKSLVNPYVVNKAQECYHMFISGILPENGGAGDQTVWFIDVSQMMNIKVQQLENEAAKGQ